MFAGNLQRSTQVKHNNSKEHKDSRECDHMRCQLYDVPNPNQQQTLPVNESSIFSNGHFIMDEYLINKTAF